MKFDNIDSCIMKTAEIIYESSEYSNGNDNIGVGLRVKVPEFITKLQTGLYPMIYTTQVLNYSQIKNTIYENLLSSAHILGEICRSLSKYGFEDNIEDTVNEFFHTLPDTVQMLKSDVAAAYEGDPAAKSHEEIMLAYPAFEAITIYRMAHKLYLMNVPILPRMMTEHAHRITGIDIHPGATIGKHFFIDHGTGVVVGETCVIGDNVKLYQGVTLGAKSFEADENGNPVKGIKRHPNIGNNVIIYAGATILGGDTTIGDNCIIGGNVWLTHSVEANQTIYYKE